MAIAIFACFEKFFVHWVEKIMRIENIVKKIRKNDILFYRYGEVGEAQGCGGACIQGCIRIFAKNI